MTVATDSPATAASDPRLSRLRAMIAEKSVLRGQFRLASGGESGLFFDMKQTLLMPEGLSLVGSLMLEKVLESRATAVGGLVLGACPIVGAIAQASYADERERRRARNRRLLRPQGAQEHRHPRADRGSRHRRPRGGHT